MKVYKVKGDREGNNWFSLRDWVNGEGGIWEFWHVETGALRQEALAVSGRWLRFEVRDAVDSTLIEGAMVALSDPESPSPPNKNGNLPGMFPARNPDPGSHPVSGQSPKSHNPQQSPEQTAKSHSPQQTSVFGMANFEDLNPALSYPFSVSKEGCFSWDGIAAPGNDNLAITVYLQRDDTSVPHKHPGTARQQPHLHTYPNPAADMLWIRFPEALGWDYWANTLTNRLQLRIFASNGRLVEAHWLDGSQGESIPLKVGHLPSGLYLLEADAGSYSVVGRFIRR